MIQSLGVNDTKARFGAAAPGDRLRRRFLGHCGVRQRPQPAAALEGGPATHRGVRVILLRGCRAVFADLQRFLFSPR